MTCRTDYSSSEWELLKRVVKFVGFGMVATSQSGVVGKLREITVLSRCLNIRAIPVQFKRNELVLALLEDTDVQALRPLTYLWRGDLGGLISAVAYAPSRVLPCCERAAALLEEKAPQPEADGAKRWLLWVARRIAEASGDRWLGLGRRVSDEETKTLHKIATSLQSSLVAAIPTASELEAMLGLAPRDANGVSGTSEGHERGRGWDG